MFKLKKTRMGYSLNGKDVLVSGGAYISYPQLTHNENRFFQDWYSHEKNLDEYINQNKK